MAAVIINTCSHPHPLVLWIFSTRAPLKVTTSTLLPWNDGRETFASEMCLVKSGEWISLSLLLWKKIVTPLSRVHMYGVQGRSGLHIFQLKNCTRYLPDVVIQQKPQACYSSEDDSKDRSQLYFTLRCWMLCPRKQSGVRSHFLQFKRCMIYGMEWRLYQSCIFETVVLTLSFPRILHAAGFAKQNVFTQIRVCMSRLALFMRLTEFFLWELWVIALFNAMIFDFKLSSSFHLCQSRFYDLPQSQCEYVEGTQSASLAPRLCGCGLHESRRNWETMG